MNNPNNPYHPNQEIGCGMSSSLQFWAQPIQIPRISADDPQTFDGYHILKILLGEVIVKSSDLHRERFGWQIPFGRFRQQRVIRANYPWILKECPNKATFSFSERDISESETTKIGWLYDINEVPKPIFKNGAVTLTQRMGEIDPDRHICVVDWIIEVTIE